MKKLLAVLLSLIALSIPAFAGCSESTNEYGYLDLSKYEVGDELPIYPDYEFSYKLEDKGIITITSATVTLEAKNIVEEGGLIEDEYYCPYNIRVKITGHTDVNVDTSIHEVIRIQIQSGILSVHLDAVPDNDGNIIWDGIQHIRYYSPLFFLSADIYELQDWELKSASNDLILSFCA